MSNFTNKSKVISDADDSAARLLIDLLEGDHTRGFDIESIFLERREDASWYFRVFEFLKAETIPPERSHPNYYWHKNSRKFLSLWTIVKVIRKAGYEADLILLNYDDARTKVKIMKVITVNPHAKEIIRAAGKRQDGSEIIEIRKWVQADEKIMSFDEFRNYFKRFNRTKAGETWDLLSELK